MNVRFYFIKDRITAGEVEVQYCPTEQMIGDFFTKALQGKKFFFFHKIIMGDPVNEPLKECVGLHTAK